MPAAEKTASKSELYFESRSRISDRDLQLLQLPGHVARLLRHPGRIGMGGGVAEDDPAGPISRKTSTYKTPSRTLSTVRKLQARTARA
jgi:hypothetical protein